MRALLPSGLKICYLIFGMALSFFQVIATFAPLEAFPVQYLGAVSAAVQAREGQGWQGLQVWHTP